MPVPRSSRRSAKLASPGITGPGTGAPSESSFVTVNLEAGLSAERQLTAGDGLTALDGGANGSFTLAVSEEFIEDLVAAMLVAGDNMGVTYDDIAGTVTFDVTGILHPHPLTFQHQRTLQVGTGSMRWYAGRNYTIGEVRGSVGTAPVGADIIVDVKLNGSSIFSLPGDRVTIPASQHTGVGTPTVVSVLDGDYFTVDIVQIGSSVAGSDLVLQIDLTTT